MGQLLLVVNDYAPPCAFFGNEAVSTRILEMATLLPPGCCRSAWPTILILHYFSLRMDIPYPIYSALRELTARGPTELTIFETFHIGHVLEQIIRGYLCGSNDKKWANNLFNYNRIATYSNVNTYFYRFEFQNRGTGHVHLLVWLRRIAKIRLPLLRADIPWSEPDLAFQVSSLQRSDKGALPANENST